MESIYELGTSPADTGFSEWVQVGIDVYNPRRKYNVKPYTHGFQLLVLLP